MEYRTKKAVFTFANHEVERQWKQGREEADRQAQETVALWQAKRNETRTKINKTYAK